MIAATTPLALLPVITSQGRSSDTMMPMALPSVGRVAIELFAWMARRTIPKTAWWPTTRCPGARLERGGRDRDRGVVRGEPERRGRAGHRADRASLHQSSRFWDAVGVNTGAARSSGRLTVPRVRSRGGRPSRGAGDTWPCLCPASSPASSRPARSGSPSSGLGAVAPPHGRQ